MGNGREAACASEVSSGVHDNREVQTLPIDSARWLRGWWPPGSSCIAVRLFSGVLVCALLLVLEHALVGKGKLETIIEALLGMNAYVSVGFFGLTLLDARA